MGPRTRYDIHMASDQQQTCIHLDHIAQLEVELDAKQHEYENLIQQRAQEHVQELEDAKSGFTTQKKQLLDRLHELELEIGERDEEMAGIAARLEHQQQARLELEEQMSKREHEFLLQNGDLRDQLDLAVRAVHDSFKAEVGAVGAQFEREKEGLIAGHTAEMQEIVAKNEEEKRKMDERFTAEVRSVIFSIITYFVVLTCLQAKTGDEIDPARIVLDVEYDPSNAQPTARTFERTNMSTDRKRRGSDSLNYRNSSNQKVRILGDNDPAIKVQSAGPSPDADHTPPQSVFAQSTPIAHEIILPFSRRHLEKSSQLSRQIYILTPLAVSTSPPQAPNGHLRVPDIDLHFQATNYGAQKQDRSSSRRRSKSAKKRSHHPNQRKQSQSQPQLQPQPQPQQPSQTPPQQQQQEEDDPMRGGEPNEYESQGGDGHSNESRHNGTTGDADGADDADISDDDDDDDDDSCPSDTEESDKSLTKEKWLAKGTQAIWTENQQKHQINRLVRDVIREAFLVRRNYQAFAGQGVSDERLRLFEEDPKKFGPKIRNTFMDRNGDSTGELELRPWNLRLRTLLVRKVMEIARECRDPNRFGTMDKKGWKSCVKERLYRIFLAVVKAIPRDDETPEAAIDRLIKAHKTYNARSKKTSIRHTKCDVRAATCSIMARRSRLTGDEVGEKFWSHGLEVVTVLGPSGMSDESDTEELNPRGFTSTREKVRQVKDLSWRHPSLRDLMLIIDNTPGAETAIFAQTGRARIRRIRVEEVDGRPPPERLYRSFFRDGYLDRLHREHVRKLKIRKAVFPLFEYRRSNRQP
ncbi:hypothetical protein V5O48_014713 [Marasmius crinis-equi]|uniref:Uncharacterized protein n=1 Tax=Marasmius crinis-equi TaxID=585013 RepID=A0ABR3EWH9_9AGAR